MTRINSLGATVVSQDHDDREACLSNALVSQKNTIIKEFNDAEDAEAIAKVVDLIDFVRPVWMACGYGYKIKEILDRVMNRCMDLEYHNKTILEMMRKNDKNRRKVVQEVEIFNDLIGRIALLRA